MNSKAWNQFADDCEARKPWPDDNLRLAAMARLLANALKQLEYDNETLLLEPRSELRS